MHLLFWRHAQAENGTPDLERPLTNHGMHQAELVARWLGSRLPQHCHILVSPAVRTQQTLAALHSTASSITPIVEPLIAPGASVADVLTAIAKLEPSNSEDTVLVVGHQPWLGLTISQLLIGHESPWAVRKSSLWWLSQSKYDDQWIIRAVVDPDLL